MFARANLQTAHPTEDLAPASFLEATAILPTVSKPDLQAVLVRTSLLITRYSIPG